MSIWGKLKDGSTGLLPHSYEKTMIAINKNALIYVEGSNFKPSFNDDKGHINNSFFAISGGSLDTTSGIKLTKENLIEIANNMKEGATLCFSVQEWLQRDNNLSDISKTFEQDNNMIQICPTSFTPNVKNK